MKKRISFLSVLVLLFSEGVCAQVGIGTTTPHNSSLLDVSATDKGFLMPRMTSVQRDAIVNPANGLILYNIETSCFNYYDVGWKDFQTKYKTVNATEAISTISTIDIDVPGITLSPSKGIYSVAFDSQILNTPIITSVIVNSETLLADYMVAYNQLEGLATTNNSHAVSFGSGEVVLPGKYSVAAAISVGGTLTLNAGGNPNALFIFKSSGAINLAASTIIILENGALAENVFWVAEGAVGVGADSVVKGNLMAHDAAVAVGASCVLEGRMLTNSGAIAFGTGTCSLPLKESSIIKLGSLNTFIAFTGIGAINNTGNSIYNGNICSGGGATTSLAAATVNGVLMPSGVNTMINSTSSLTTLATFGIYQNGILIPSSRKQITCNSTYINLSLLAIANVLDGESITVKWKIDSGTLTLGNRILTSIKVQ